MLPEETTKFIGQGKSTKILEVEKGAIRKFADAVNDHNRLYWDEDYARRLGYRSVIAPPGFFGWPVKWTKAGPHFTEETERMRVALGRAGYDRSLDGGIDYEFFRPVQAGDTLVASSVIKDIIERQGTTGKLAFLILETTYTNENGELVAKARTILIHRA